jgi:cobyrinic acid a,c-diamide synthase
MHRQATGRPSYNLDTYLVPAARVRDTFCRVAHDADIAIIEGVMGLFDGSSPTSRMGSTAEVAVLLQAPIVLVIDASGMAASVGALVRGFRTYDPDVCVAGVILNRLGSAAMRATSSQPLRAQGGDFGISAPRCRIDHPGTASGLLPTSEDDVNRS